MKSEIKLRPALLLLLVCFVSFFFPGMLHSQDEDTEVIDVNEAAAICAIDAKLDGIIIPHLEFAETPFKDSVAYLRAVSIEMDHDEIDPEKKGLRIVSEAPDPDDALISMRLVNVSLREALRYVAALGQAEVTVTARGVVLVPVGKEPGMPTKVYQFSSNFAKNTIEEKAARVVLENAGIEFKAGAAVVFDSNSFQLIVRNTESEHAKVRAFLVAFEGENQ